MKNLITVILMGLGVCAYAGKSEVEIVKELYENAERPATLDDFGYVDDPKWRCLSVYSDKSGKEIVAFESKLERVSYQGILPDGLQLQILAGPDRGFIVRFDLQWSDDKDFVLSNSNSQPVSICLHQRQGSKLEGTLNFLTNCKKELIEMGKTPRSCVSAEDEFCFDETDLTGTLTREARVRISGKFLVYYLSAEYTFDKSEAKGKFAVAGPIVSPFLSEEEHGYCWID